MRKLAFALIALFIPLIILVAATEATLRWIGLGDPLLYYVSPEFGYALQPAQKRKRLRGAFVTINRSGLRSSREWSEKTDQKILFVGDSITYGGSYIDDSQLFSELTCTNLAQAVKRKFLCGNAGTNAYGISNMVGRLRYENYSDADVIVVTIGSGDAIRGMTGLGSLPYFRLSPARTGLPGLAEAVAFVLDIVRGKLRFGSIGPESSDISDERKARFARDSIDALVIELRRLQTDGKTVLLVHSPAQVHVEEDYSDFDRIVLEAVRASGLPFLEMRDELKGKDLDAIFYDGWHLDVPGHALYGKILARTLAQMIQSSR